MQSIPHHHRDWVDLDPTTDSDSEALAAYADPQPRGRPHSEQRFATGQHMKPTQMAATASQLSNGGSPFYGAAGSSSENKDNPQNHTRTYQACIPCRRRKVRCDLGPVDNPHDPPCVRCRREAKECFFSATRRKKKGNESGGGSEVGTPEPYEIRGGRKRLRASTSVSELEGYADDPYEEPPLTPGGSKGRTQPLRRPSAPKPVQYTEEDENLSNQAAAILQSEPVHNGHDALKVLYAAAVHGRSGSMNSVRPSLNGFTSSSLPPATSPIMDRAVPYGSSTPGGRLRQAPPPQVDPSIMQVDIASLVNTNSPYYANAVKAWSRFRFVRAGWFTAAEGIAYVEYFYRYHSVLTPVAPLDFRGLETHESLLTQEPMLAVTILMVASRYMDLVGPGRLTRPYAIHQKLWAYLQNMIDRLVWGQEQFGGGFCGAGAQPGCDVNPLSRKGLRTLGTVESLMLLTEWHPRAMHFPPDENEAELMVPDGNSAAETLVGDDPDGSKGIGGQPMDTWLEPCWRSDRMCWMLLGMAMSLAFEIGVFDRDGSKRHRSPSSQNLGTLSESQQQSYDKRRDNLKNLLLVFVTQTAGRVGLTSMLPQHYCEPALSEIYELGFGQHKSVQEQTVHFWLRMAALMKAGNQQLFQNKEYTRTVIRNGQYRVLLEDLQPQLTKWQRDFDKCIEVPVHMRHILQIEYEYCRAFVNSVSLQAVAERIANNTPPQSSVQPVGGVIDAKGQQSKAVPPDVLSKWLGNDRRYIDETSTAARNILTSVVDGLCPGGYLKHAPVRTYFRIISSTILLFKCLCLGANANDVASSLSLVDRTAVALQTCIVDDVHVAARFAELLSVLSEAMRVRFVRMAPNGGNGRSRRTSGTSETLRFTQFSSNPQSQQHTRAGATQGQQWSRGNSTPQSALQSIRNTPSHPLYGISNETYDLMGGDNSFSVMPPPTMFGMDSPNLSSNQMSSSNGNGYDPYNTGNNFTADDGTLPDWLALPLDPLLNISGADVNQTMYGPELGGQDMLELLLNGNNGNGNFQ